MELLLSGRISRGKLEWGPASKRAGEQKMLSKYIRTSPNNSQSPSWIFANASIAMPWTGGKGLSPFNAFRQPPLRKARRVMTTSGKP